MTEQSFEGKKVFVPFQSGIIVGEVIGTYISEEDTYVGSFDEGVEDTKIPAGTVFHTLIIHRNANPEDNLYVPGNTITVSKDFLHPVIEE